MKIGEEMLHVGFFLQHTPAEERIARLDGLEHELAWTGLKTFRQLEQHTKGSSSLVAKDLLQRNDPHNAEQLAQQQSIPISEAALALPAMEGVVNAHKQGVSAEIAIHNFVLWGVARLHKGRYVRMTSAREDESSRFGKRNGFDIIYRTDFRRWKLQTKTSRMISNTHGYDDDIIVVSPDVILRDSGARADDLHAAIVNDDERVLKSGWDSFMYELRNQKSKNPSGYRKVV